MFILDFKFMILRFWFNALSRVFFCARPPRYILSHTLLFCLRQPATLLATRTAFFFLLRTFVRLFLCHLPRKIRLPRFFCLCYTLSLALLRSTLNHQAKCARHAFFCSRYSRACFAPTAHYAFFIFIILNSARIF